MSQLPSLSVDNSAINRIPGLMPPPGITPNFAHPRNRGPVVIIVNETLLALMMIVIAIRAYTKLAIIRKVSWDDLTVSFATLGAIALYILVLWEIKKARLGRHQWDIRLGDLLQNDFVIPVYLIEVVSIPTLWFTKLTFFLLYTKIFWPMRWLRISIYIGVTLSTAFYLGVIIALCVLATPRPGESWMAAMLSEREQTASKLAIPISSIGLVVDVLLLVLPSVAVFKLQLDTKRKIGLMLIFSTGLVAVVASAMSIYFRYVDIHSKDTTWNLLNLQIMILVEIQVGVITASMPSFARMLHHHLPPWKQLKLRLSFRKIASQTRSSKMPRPNLFESSKPRLEENKLPYISESPLFNHGGRKAEGNGTTEAPNFEVDSFKSARTFIEGGQLENVNEDGSAHS